MHKKSSSRFLLYVKCSRKAFTNYFFSVSIAFLASILESQFNINSHLPFSRVDARNSENNAENMQFYWITLFCDYWTSKSYLTLLYIPENNFSTPRIIPGNKTVLSLLCHLSINLSQSVHVARIVLVLAENNRQCRKAKFIIVVIQVFATLRG